MSLTCLAEGLLPVIGSLPGPGWGGSRSLDHDQPTWRREKVSRGSLPSFWELLPGSDTFPSINVAYSWLPETRKYHLPLGLGVAGSWGTHSTFPRWATRNRSPVRLLRRKGSRHLQIILPDNKTKCHCQNNPRISNVTVFSPNADTKNLFF